MRRIIVIGTIHGGFTSHKELKMTLEKINPDKLLIEIAKDNIKNNKLKYYPPEMLFAYKWAKANNIRVSGFDPQINELKKHVTKKDKNKLMREQIKLLGNKSWKVMNREKNSKIFNTSYYYSLIDRKKEYKRNKMMLQNIKRLLLKKGTTLVLTGSGHLNFFEKHLRNAEFPFRK